MGFVSPEVFGLHMVVLGFTMLYVGGIGTVCGPLFGALSRQGCCRRPSAASRSTRIWPTARLIRILIYAPKGLAAGADRPRR